MGIHKLVSSLLCASVILGAILMGAPLPIFIDPPSVLFVSGILVGGIFWSHPARQIREAFGLAWGVKPIPPEQAKRAISVFQQLEQLAFAAAILGPLIGIIQMLQVMSDPTAIGPAMAVALLTAFYGIILAVLCFRASIANLKARGKPQAIEPEAKAATGDSAQTPLPASLPARTLLGFVLVSSFISLLILSGSPLANFVDLPCIIVVVGITVSGLYMAFPHQHIKRVLGIYFSEGDISQQAAQDCQSVFRHAANLAVASGLIGTLIGLVQMLQAMEDPTAIGPAMAVALLTLMYGMILRLFCLNAAAQCANRASGDDGTKADQPPDIVWKSTTILFLILVSFFVMLLAMGEFFNPETCEDGDNPCAAAESSADEKGIQPEQEESVLPPDASSEEGTQNACQPGND